MRHTPSHERGVIDDVCRVLALRANGIGDFLVVIPALTAVRHAYPDAEITVVGDAWLPALVAGRPGPWDRCLVAPKYPGLRGLPTGAAPPAAAAADTEQFVAARRRERFDLALQLHGGGGTSNTFVSSLGARVTAGARADGAPPLDRTVPYLPHRHEVLRWLDVVALVGATHLGAVDELTPRIVLTERDRDEARRVLPGATPYVALHLGARDARRRWPAERFVELGRRILDAGLDLVIVGGPDDRAGAARATAQLADRDRVRNVTGRLSLSGTIGVLAGAAGFVGNDSGPRHLAAAVGTPTVGVFWLTNVFAFGPLVGVADRALVSQQVHCPVCGEEQVETRCEHDVSLVDAVTVDEVEAALWQVLGVERRRPASRPPADVGAEQAAG